MGCAAGAESLRIDPFEGAPMPTSTGPLPLRVDGETCASCEDAKRSEGHVCYDCGSVADGTGGVLPIWFPWPGSPPCLRVVDLNGDHVAFEVNAAQFQRYSVVISWQFPDWQGNSVWVVDPEDLDAADADTREELIASVRDRIIEGLVDSGATVECNDGRSVVVEVPRDVLRAAVTSAVDEGEMAIKYGDGHPRPIAGNER